MGFRYFCCSDICFIIVVFGDLDLDSFDVVLDWRGRFRNKLVSDRFNEVNCMILCEVK